MMHFVDIAIGRNAIVGSAVGSADSTLFSVDPIWEIFTVVIFEAVEVGKGLLEVDGLLGFVEGV
jgi:hypothetical protein